MKQIHLLLASILFIFGITNYSCLSNKNTPNIENYGSSSGTPFKSHVFEFEFEGRKLSGLLDIPKSQKAKTLVVLVPGHGKTNIASGQWNLALRTRLAKSGMAIFAYDKTGCGNSPGVYDGNQTVENSSEEVLAAITALRRHSNTENIGLWGISRAGWIIPLVIQKDPGIAFWISVSGPNHLDNMKHLLESNWQINGKSKDEIAILAKEWLRGFEIQRNGGAYEEYLKATPNLSTDEFIKKVRGGEYTQARFLNYQEYLLKNRPVIDKESGLTVIVPGFEKILQDIRCPVLAIAGEKDTQVDIKKTFDLYKKTINDNLTMKILPNCNHSIQICDNCGYSESYRTLVEKGLGQTCEGYYGTILDWLAQKGF